MIHLSNRIKETCDKYMAENGASPVQSYRSVNLDVMALSYKVKDKVVDVIVTGLELSQLLLKPPQDIDDMMKQRCELAIKEVLS